MKIYAEYRRPNLREVADMEDNPMKISTDGMEGSS
jgi:hypothetical protein